MLYIINATANISLTVKGEKMISVEEANRRQYDKDMEKYDCGYWSVCEDHACGCAVSDNVDGFDNEVYQKWKLELQRQAEEFYEDRDDYDYELEDYDADDFYEDDDNYYRD
jgi:hypothetical protein